MSPHRLFQELWDAVDKGHHGDIQALVDALVHLLHGRHRLASSAVTELVRVAVQRQCPPEIVDALTRLPGFLPGSSLIPEPAA